MKDTVKTKSAVGFMVLIAIALGTVIGGDVTVKKGGITATDMVEVTNTTDSYGRLISAVKSDYNLQSAASTQYPVDVTARTGTGDTYGSKVFYGASFTVKGRSTGSTQQTGNMVGFYAFGENLGTAYINTKLVGGRGEGLSSASGNINELIGFDGVVKNQGNGSTVSKMAAMKAGGYTNHSNATASNYYGFYSERFRTYAGTATNVYGLYLENQDQGTNKWGIYQAGSYLTSYFEGTISAKDVIDRTPAWAGTAQEALQSILSIRSAKGEIDHSSLPEIAKRRLKREERFNFRLVHNEEVGACDQVYDTRIVEEDGRSLSGMVTVLVEAVKALHEENQMLKAELAAVKAAVGVK